MRLILVGVCFRRSLVRGTHPGLVILYEFDNTYSNGAFADMREELAGIMQKTGMDIEWHAKTVNVVPTHFLADS